MPLQGHCNCNAIQVTLQDLPSGEPHQTTYCHCTTCKRQSGVSGTWVTMPESKLVEIKDPKDLMKMWKDTMTDSGTPAERYFCGECGSPLYTKTPLMPDNTLLKMGLFDSAPPVVLEMYIKNKEKWEPTIEGVKIAQGAP